MGVILDARHELFLTSLFIQLFYNNYLRGGIESMLKRSAREKDKGNSACTLLSLYAYTYAWTTRHFVVMFCLRDVLSVCFLFCFVLFDCLFVCLFVLINEANWWTWDSQIRWCLEIPSMTQPRPHCAFPWLLDKLRWTQAMVTAASHFLVQNRVRILRTGQHTPTKNFQEYPLGDLKPDSKFTCQHPLANYQML